MLIFFSVNLISTDKCVLVSSGMQADRFTLHKYLEARLQTYTFAHRRDMSTPAIAQLLSTTLYGRRFMPYYTFNVVAGLDDNGKGWLTHS
jgi:20S proteasome subunit beta 6